MLRFFRRSATASDHGVLKKFLERNASLPGESQYPLVTLKGPSIPGLLMAEEFRNIVVIKE
jgi:hypothetical protein